MKKILITGARSYVGTNVERYLAKYSNEFEVDLVSTRNNEWKKTNFSMYDVVFHVAGIAHVDAKKKMEPLYRSVNTDLTIEVAKWAKEHGVRQFIFMSSMIIYHESKSLKRNVITYDTKPDPNNFYGDSKLQAELGLNGLSDENFKVCIIRSPMIYVPGCKGNFLRLVKLATKCPIFPAFHNKRSMLYIDNLSEFVRQAVLNEIRGTYFPQNKELSDTVEICKYFANANNHKLHVWKWLNIFVYMGSPFITAIDKMFSDSYYIPEMSKYHFEYQLVSQEESFNNINASDLQSKNLS